MTLGNNNEAKCLQPSSGRASKLPTTRHLSCRILLLLTICGSNLFLTASRTENATTFVNVTVNLTALTTNSTSRTRNPTTSPSPIILGPTPRAATNITRRQPNSPQQQGRPSYLNYTVTVRAAPYSNNETTPTQRKPSNNSTSGNTNMTAPRIENPSKRPSFYPTNKPSKRPSFYPTNKPTIRTDAPTASFRPTFVPSDVPSMTPSNSPTTPPTSEPTRLPVKRPTSIPTNIPSFAPTLNETSSTLAQYQQIFNGNSNLTQMNDTQIIFFESALQSYTYNYTGYQGSRITTIADVMDQLVTVDTETTPASRRILTAAKSQLYVRYSMEWLSNQTNVSEAPLLFEKWMKNSTNSAEFIYSLNKGTGLDLDPNSSIFSVKPQPTSSPTASPTPAPTAPARKESNSVTIVVAAVAGVGFSLLVGVCLWFFYVRRRRRRKQQQQMQKASTIGTVGEHYHKGGGQFAILESTSESPPHQQQFRSIGYINNSFSEKDMLYMLEPTDATPVGITQQEEALDRNPSMVSESLEEDYPTSDEDDSYILEAQNAIIDEFDRYKNQDLEKMREEVKGNVGNMDGMMSQALTKVLMDQDEHDTKALLWGANAPGDSAEIEASVLCETHDWLKRKEDATLEERNAFMQGLLNRMVATVRYNYIPPEKGSRAIHGAAAMLGLQLAGDLPETAILVSGMRHKAEKKDLIEAFKVFGEIEDAAVAPNFRGFGLVRFLSPKAVQRATERYRTDRIDVQDVSVNVRVLSAPASSLPPGADVTRQLSSGQLAPSGNASVSSAAAAIRGVAVPQQVVRNPAERRMDRGRGVMEVNVLPHMELNTIGYPSDSLGRTNDGEKGKRVLRTALSGDAGSIGGLSRCSSRDPAANAKDYP